MKIDIIILAECVLIAFSVFNGLVIKWHNAHGPNYLPLDDYTNYMRTAKIKDLNEKWHRFGLSLRVSVWLIIFFASERNYLLTTIFIAVDCIAFPVTINLINNLKWYYVGTTAKTDKLIRKMFPRLNFDK